MKKITLISFLFCAIIGLVLIGCEQPEPEPEPEPKPEKPSITVGKVSVIPFEGGTFDVGVQYNTEFTVEVDKSAQSWITFVQTKALTEGKLEFRFEPNDYLERKGSVTVKDVNGKVKSVTLTFVQQDGFEPQLKQILMDFYNAMDGPNWTKQDNWGTDKGLDDWRGVDYDKKTGNLQLTFNGFGLKGVLPECIGRLTTLRSLSIVNEPELEGTLPSSFAGLVNLKYFGLSNTSLTSLPDIFGNMNALENVLIGSNQSLGGSLPNSLGSLPSLQKINIQNNLFTGGLPSGWTRIGIQNLYLGGNCLAGEIPQEYIDAADIATLIEHVLWQRTGYGFDMTDYDIKGHSCWPGGPVQDLNGNTFSFDDVMRENRYTVYINWSPWDSFSKVLMPELKDYYDAHHADGLEVIATVMLGPNGLWNDLNWQKREIEENGYDSWINFYWPDVSSSFLASVPAAEVYDSDGYIVFSSFSNYPDPVRNRFGRNAYAELIPFLESLLGPIDDYSSTDYSQDGKVMKLQTASVGNGINVVFMGDAYTDRDMAAGGKYETAMRNAMEEFFSIEPYKTFRNRFNVYAVKVVSLNGRIGTGYTTALESAYGAGTEVLGNPDKCFAYAKMVPTITNEEDLLVSVLVNSSRCIGTTWMSYLRRSCISFTTTAGSVSELYGPVLRHEAGGHGFAFLADEYADYDETAPVDHIDLYNSRYRDYGWYSNVDFTNDPSSIRWSAFLSDDRYKDEVGIFEGAALYEKGAYRPSEKSIMRYTDEANYFNAPSRWTIYKRIMELSGENYSFETFLEYDEVNRGTHASQSSFSAGRKSTGQLKDWHPGAPPVVVP